MYSRIIHITLLAVVLFLVFSVSPSLSQDVPSQYEEDLLQLINEARENPLIVASSLGMDADQILQDFPELKDILIYGLPPLIFNENLYAAAGAHTRDMLENNYYSHTSLDGRTYDGRIVESGYDPVVTGESLGMLAFYNFIEPDEAVELIFENMFRDELDAERTERRNILGSDLEEVGIGFGSGAFTIDGSIYNAYMITCDFATSVFSVMELELLELINQARENPLIVATSFGMDADQILQDFPELKDILTNGLPPLIFNENLYAAAGAHTRDMLENNYYSHTSLDGRTYDGRIVESGYDPVVTGESLGMLAFYNFIEPADAVELIFENMFRDELDPERTERRNILAGDLEEAGIAIGAGTLNLSGSLYNVYVATCDFGAPLAEQEGPYLMGVVYRDLNEDMFYSPGEGLPGFAVYIDIPNEMLEVLTDAAGGFCLMLDPGATRVIAELPEGKTECWVYLEEENQRVEFIAESDSLN
jgi:uncharacterized protein YkwD